VLLNARPALQKLYACFAFAFVGSTRLDEVSAEWIEKNIKRPAQLVIVLAYNLAPQLFQI
jgi:hypothetical protein